jgi:predicted neuraminidase
MTLICSLVAMTVLGEAPLLEQEPIFSPNPKHNHGSSIVETPGGDLIAAWFHGSGERRSDDVLIQGARKRKDSGEWSEPFVMADSRDLPDCNPVLFIDPRGTLWLFWIAVQNNEWGGSLLKYRTSTQYIEDGPPKWEWQDVIHCRLVDLEPMFLEALAAAETMYAEHLKANESLRAEVEMMKSSAKDKLTQRLGWMTRVHPIMTSDNRVMLGLYSDVFNCSAAAFTADWGGTWTFSRPIITPEFGNIQPSFVAKKNGEIVAFMRDNGLPNRVRTASSTDGGITWGDVIHTEVPNPGSSVECVALKSGRWALVCNDTVEGRHLLTVYLSDDEGATWKWKRSLETMDPGKGSASYPSMIQAADGAIHCTYSFVQEGIQGSTIKHARFNEAWLEG